MYSGFCKRALQAERSAGRPRRRARSSANGLTAAAAALAAALTLLGCHKDDTTAERPPPTVSVVEIRPQDVPVSMDFIAQTQSSQQVEIYARVTGFLDKRLYTEGGTVKAGSVLFQMDAQPYQVQEAAAKAALAQQEARLSVATAKLNRVRPLTALNALAQKDLDNATGEVQSSQALVDQARANLAQADLNLSYTKITSPVTGLTAAATQQDGTYIGSLNTKLTSVAVMNPMWVNYSISENLLLSIRNQLQSGQLRGPKDETHDVDITLPDGSLFPHKGRISFVSPSFDVRTGTYLVRATVENPEGLLRPNQYVRSRVLGYMRPNAILVPQRAVQQSAKGQVVWVVNGDGKAELRPVEVGDWHGEDWFVTQGLSAGDKVIVEGITTLQPGMLVKATPLAPPKTNAGTNSGAATDPGRG